MWLCCKSSFKTAVSGLQIQAEARIRLVSGIKRYFHGKRGEGLLSARGMQLLDFICDVQMDHADRPLFMWAYAERWESLPSCGTGSSTLAPFDKDLHARYCFSNVFWSWCLLQFTSDLETALSVSGLL